MKRTNLLTAIAAIGLAGSLAGCGDPASQDSSSDNTNVATGVRLTGTVVDGYVARGVVWVDHNNNGELNISTGETFAFTDNDGNYSKGYGPDGVYGTSDDVNYCGFDKTSTNYTYCLTGNFAPNTEYTLRLKKGYDLTTGEPFSGILTRKVTTDANGNLPAVIISPLTTLTANMDASQKGQLATALGLTDPDELDSDFLNPNALGDSTGAKNKTLMAAALQVQKFSEVATKNIEKAAGSKAPKNTSDLVFKAIAEQVVTNNGDLDAATTGTGATAAVNKAAADVSTSAGVTVTPPAGTDTAAAQVSTSTKNVINATAGADVNTVLTNAKQGARAVQVVTNVAANDPSNTTGINNATTLAGDSAFVAKLDDTADLDDVTTNVGDGTVTSSTQIDYSTRPCLAKNYDDTTSTWSVCGDTDLIRSWFKADDSASDDYVVMNFYDTLANYFGVADDSDEGLVALCVNYQSDPNSEYAVSHKSFVGTWKRMNNYSIILNVVLVGSNPDALIAKSIKDIDKDNSGDRTAGDVWRMTMDYAGEINTWDSTLPATGGFFTDGYRIPLELNSQNRPIVSPTFSCQASFAP